MTLDQLIAHLQEVRTRHGGNHAVMVGQRHPENPNLWSGVPVETGNINETISDASITSVPGYQHKAGWIWFEFPISGIQHRKLRGQPPQG